MNDDVESQISLWRGYVQGRRAISGADIAEMEDHLRERIDELIASGLEPDEAFLVAVKRMGSVDDISREFAREHSDRLWKQLVLTPTDDSSPGSGRDLWSALAFAGGAAVAIRAALTWLSADAFAHNVVLLVLAFVAAYFAWKRRGSAGALASVGFIFAVSAIVMNSYPWAHLNSSDSRTEVLAVLHLPIVLWVVVGLAYVGGDWSSHRRRMDFIRFTGEWVVYLALLALGGGVLMALTAGALQALGIDAEPILSGWVLPCGAAGATVVAAWLVEAKQDVVENMAPVLTKVFTPLTIILIVALLGALASRHTFVRLDRDLLTVMDLILVLVLGLVLYAISAREPGATPGMFDRLQFVLLAAALAADAVLLVAMLARIADAGLTANKVAALGMNLVLLVNLVWSTRLLARFNRGASSFAAMERWQTGYLPIYGIWAAVVVAALPPLFRFA